MLKKLSSFLFKDLGWRILALISAILLWNVVMSMEDPYIKRSVFKALELVNEESLEQNRFIIMNRDKLLTNVKINLQGRRSDILQHFYNQSTYVAAYVDLGGLDASYNSMLGAPISLPIIVEVRSNLAAVLDQSPGEVKIIIDKMVTRSMKVNVEITGDPAEGFETVRPSYTDVVDVTGPQTILDTVERVVTSVSVEDADREVEVENSPLSVMGLDGKVIPMAGDSSAIDSVSLSVDTISVKVQVYPKKTVPLRAVPEGDAEDGYWISGLVVDPPEMELVGPQEELDAIEEVVLKPVLINGANESFEVSRNVNDSLEGKVLVGSGNSPSVNVSVTVEEESVKDLLVQFTNISVIRDSASLTPQMSNDPVTVTVRGPSTELEKLNNYNVRAELDLSGLSKGIYDVPLHFDFFPAEGVKLVRMVFVRVVIGDDLNTAAILSGFTEAEET